MRHALLSCGLIPENEISKTAGVELNPVTSGPVVNESLETNVPGVFACGNVLHVHDLVDYVSEEATAAGRHAAEYVKNGGDKSCDGKEISITATGGVRYTVPSTINTAQMDDTVTVRFQWELCIRIVILQYIWMINNYSTASAL